MATQGNAWAQSSDTHDPNVLRGFAAAVFGLPVASHANAISDTARAGGYGVAGGQDACKVAGTGGLNYSIAAGRVVAAGTSSSAQGAYVGYNTAGYTASLDAHSAFIRHDLICYRVRDTDVDGSGAEQDDFAVVKGTTGSTDPAIPASLGSLVVLARAVVPATSGMPTFTDLRPRVTAAGGIHVCTSTTRPTTAALFEGLHIYETDTDRTWVNTSSTTLATWVAVHGRHGATLVHAAASIASLATVALTWDTEDEDTDGYHSGTSADYTIPATLGGTYSFTLNVSASGVVSAACDVALYVGAFQIGQSYIPAGKVSAMTLNVTMPILGGSVITAQVYNGHSGALSFAATLRAYLVAG